MRLRIPKGSWCYGLGLILLFTLAAVATRTVIYSVDHSIDQQEYETARQISMAGTWLLSMGLMFLAAGLGMWAIQYASFRESVRRLGSFIDAMDYLRDGLVALDKKGNVVNANPAAKTLAPELRNTREPFLAAFPCLSESDLQALVNSRQPYEIECEVIGVQALRTLRFRTQSTADLPLVLISDVTERKELESRQREAARLQLIGRISRGVADDFNRILSVISGQTGLLSRLCEGHEGSRQAAGEIYRAIQSGSNLATHLLDLSQTDTQDVPTDYIEQPLQRAVELMRLALPPGWIIDSDIAKGLPPVKLSALQVEQAVMNLGLICCDNFQRPGTVKISARVPGHDHLDNVGHRYAMIILVSAMHVGEDALLDMPPMDQEGLHAVQEDTGAVLTIVRSALEGSGARLDCLQSGHDTKVFRIALPMSRYVGKAEDVPDLPDNLRSRVAGKSLLLAVVAGRGDEIEKQARYLNIRVTRAVNTVSLLAGLEEGVFDAALIDSRLLEPETGVMIRAIAKLRPNLPLLVLGPATRLNKERFPDGVSFFQASASMQSLFEALAGTDSSSQAQIVDQAHVT